MSDSLYSMFRRISQQVGYIERDVRNICNSFAEDVSLQAAEDLKEAHQKIIDKYYDAYDPNKYNRSYNLYDSGIIQEPIKKGDGKFSSGIVIGSFNMLDIYNISPDNIFDLTWNEGIRGLPKESEDGNWVNPYWDQSEYANEFRTSIKVGKYKTIEGTPDEVFEDFVNNWGKSNGKQACKQAENRIKAKYSKTTY